MTINNKKPAYDMDFINKYSYLLTPEVMATMPNSIHGEGILTWKSDKIKLLLKKQRDESNIANDTVIESNTTSDTAKKTHAKDSTTTSTKKKQSGRDIEEIRDVPKDVVKAMRMMLPTDAKKADLLTAFVYIFTDGACKLTPKAAELVESYKKTDNLININERLGRIESLLRENREQLYSVELCANFDLYDRRFGAKQPRRYVEEIDFCEPNSLKMLEKLRYQGREQLKIDNMRRGRNIYAETKDKNDKNN